jgi:hypothetical protein
VPAAPAPVSKPHDESPLDEPRAYVADDPLGFSGRDADYFVVPVAVVEHWRAARRNDGPDV